MIILLASPSSLTEILRNAESRFMFHASHESNDVDWRIYSSIYFVCLPPNTKVRHVSLVTSLVKQSEITRPVCFALQ